MTPRCCDHGIRESNLDGESDVDDDDDDDDDGDADDDYDVYDGDDEGDIRDDDDAEVIARRAEDWEVPGSSPTQD